jgi:hypothetical protein
MLQRKIKLGKGELEHINDVEMPYSVRDARDYFLDAVKEVKPEVLDDLAGEPFRLYKAAGLNFEREHYRKEFENLELYDGIRAMARLENQHRWNHPDWFGHFENKEVDYNENIRAMQKSIFDWSKNYNLDANWCRARAYETLDWWHRFESFYENRLWNYETEMQPMIATHRGEMDFVFRIRSNYPMFGFRPDEGKRITEAFKRELKIFFGEREKIAKENGMAKPKQKREYLHFIWLARWQIDETLTHEKITKELSEDEANPKFLDVQAVSKAIKEVAALIGLPLRKAKRGRKTKL